MKEQLIEKLKLIRNYFNDIGNTEYNKIITETLLAITSVKSESAEDVLITAYQGVLGDINREEIEELKTEDSVEGRMFRATIQTMHDFANNSEAMKENAIGLLNYYFKEKMKLDNLNDFNDLYTEYLTNKEK